MREASFGTKYAAGAVWCCGNFRQRSRSFWSRSQDCGRAARWPIHGGRETSLRDEGGGHQKLGVAPALLPEDDWGWDCVGGMDLTDDVMIRSYKEGGKFFAEQKKPKNFRRRS